MANYLLIDGYNMAFRAFYAVKELKRSDGFPTNALYGWVRSMWKLLDDQKPDFVTVFFDLGGAQDKLALLPEYKANRAETPAEFEQQVPIIKQLTRAMGFGLIEENGVESDDLLAAYATRLTEGDAAAVVKIVSADKDFAQSVTERIHLLLPPPTANPRLGWRELDPAGVEEKWGLPPERMVDYLSLIGDTSDNIPGVPGCGPKTAVKWLLEYGSVEGVLEHADSIRPPRFQAILPELEERLKINRKIIGFDLSHHGTSELDTGSMDLPALCSILEEMEMKTHLEEAKKRYAQAELF
ncbi:5'-3' exonuclease H3TH domain-containing protein [Pelagicoccus sp. SDUM812003]|uniref:5'-3' exonuclease n=1 Tax=Pelagicoccus sp. SDUM812003 TaxID=3041267 RepID=UPI00280DBA3D|nr:5'-3' exonuclease H3TH domain-containing protein [Pelagicoccus sp. SDUM812003]MDQ8204478.1 5'-3' exonuclease H3TH domain-containing protein [Pelagicoccus sp. SDUM812003]